MYPDPTIEERQWHSQPGRQAPQQLHGGRAPPTAGMLANYRRRVWCYISVSTCDISFWGTNFQEGYIFRCTNFQEQYVPKYVHHEIKPSSMYLSGNLYPQNM